MSPPDGRAARDSAELGGAELGAAAVDGAPAATPAPAPAAAPAAAEALSTLPADDPVALSLQWMLRCMRDAIKAQPSRVPPGVVGFRLFAMLPDGSLREAPNRLARGDAATGGGSRPRRTDQGWPRPRLDIALRDHKLCLF